MSRASHPAARTTPPEPPTDLPPLPDPLAGVPRWRYAGDAERIYMSVPVTVRWGDVIALPTIPADDGCWEPTDEAWTRRPDNYTAEV